MGNPIVLAKYQQFADDFNSGLDRAALCGKYNIPENRFDSYLEFLRRQGYSLEAPALPPPPRSSQKEDAPSGAERKKSALFARIETCDDALKTIKDVSCAFYFVAGLQGILGFFVFRPMIMDGIVYGVLAFLLHKFSSRVAAVFLFLMASISLIVTVMNKIGLSSQGGGNIFLAVIVLVVSARAIEATFKLRGQFKAASPVTG